MSRQLENYGINILQLHAAWLKDNGYKPQAKYFKKKIIIILINRKKKQKRQASSLTITVGFDRIRKIERKI